MTNPLGLIKSTDNLKLDERLILLEEYDFSPITLSCINRYGWDEELAKKTEVEAKRFFSLAFLDNGYYHIPEENVDEYWHRMILHTKWYTQFCTTIFGEYYHHMPEPDSEALDEKSRNRSLSVMQHWYGYQWESLVKTCTQCKGPITHTGLYPSDDLKFKG